MKWSIKIGRFSGIDVYMHLTFLVLISWVAFMHWRQGQNLVAVLSGVGFVLAVFFCVLLHEYGHALTARRFGVQTRDIILLPIGGLARLERLPENPIEEIWVALAGPAVNVVIAVGLFLSLLLTATLEPIQMLTITAGPFLERLMFVNIFLVLFNLIPAFPMDGGRVLRAILATRLDYGRATQKAASIGQGIAFLFGIFGFFYNPFLIFIAIFIWFAASQEASMTQIKSAISGIPLVQATLTDFKTLKTTDSLDDAVKLTLAGSQKDFPVMNNGRIEGILTQSDLLKALADRHLHPTVSTAMQKNFVTVNALEMLETALSKIRECNCHTILVTLRGKLVGLLTMDNLGEFMRIQAALKNRPLYDKT